MNSPKAATIEDLNKAINELRSTIDSMPEGDTKKKLNKTLKNLKHTHKRLTLLYSALFVSFALLSWAAICYFKKKKAL